MPTLQTKEACTGCSACAVVCRQDAIRIKINEEGFYEPKIDPDKCVECGCCTKVCPVGKKEKVTPIASYYGYHTNEEVARSSSSGGAFRALADEVMKEGGVVFGAVFTPDFKEVVFAGTDEKDIRELQFSKYVASNADGVYARIKDELNHGRKVLFCGAPCQAAGLKSFLGKEDPNLLTVDFICGGMPSVSFWHEHIEYWEKKYHSKITKVVFRSKKQNWGKQLLEICFENGKTVFKREYQDTYFGCFVQEHASVRECCISCNFADKHCSDITIADFWGYRAANVEYRELGLSLIIANTNQGETAIRNLRNMKISPLESRHSAYAIGARAEDREGRKKRDAFFELASEIGFEKAARRLYPPTTFRQVRKYLKTRFHRR